MKTFFAFLALSELIAGYSTSLGQTLTSNSDSTKTALYIPNQIKINSKGNLEKWKIEHLEQYPNHHLKIFNRRGHMIYQSTKYQHNWPEGIPAEDKYFYILELDGKRVSGWLEIEI